MKQKKCPLICLIICIYSIITLLIITIGSASGADLPEVKKIGVLHHLGVPYASFITGSGDGLVSQVLEKQPTPENVEVTIAIPPDLPAVFVDSVKIGQVLSNLVTNAYQAMPEGGKLTISAQAEK